MVQALTWSARTSELRVSVVSADERPKIDPPRLTGARTCAIGTEVRPITTSSIGSVVARENLYVARFRVVPERAGTLEIPAIQAQIKGRSGRSQPKSMSIQSVPLLGRPAEFLGESVNLSFHAEASPNVVRVGQELDFRIKITGPAAWGMTERPDPGALRSPRARAADRAQKPDETIERAPARTFVYRVRPTRRRSRSAAGRDRGVRPFSFALRHSRHGGRAPPRCRGPILRSHDAQR